VALVQARLDNRLVHVGVCGGWRTGIPEFRVAKIVGLQHQKAITTTKCKINPFAQRDQLRIVGESDFQLATLLICVEN